MLALPETLMHAQAKACLTDLLQGMAQAPSPVQLDAGSLQNFDSSALAVLLACRRSAQAQGKALSVQGCPQRLQDLAQLYGVAELLFSRLSRVGPVVLTP